MPMGPGPIAFVAFVGVKFIGYTAAAKVLQRTYEAPQVSVMKVGSARTALGVVAGLAYGAIWMFATRKIVGRPGPSMVWYFLGLVPVRMGEWSLILWTFFDKKDPDRTRLLIFAGLGSLWSYALDAIGVGTALVIPGGMWVC
jgi:hypothetical protein